MTFYEIVNMIDGFLWGTPMLVIVLGCGLFYTVYTKFFIIRHLGHALKHTLGKSLTKEGRRAGRNGALSSFESVCIAIGGCVGTANVVGVATAIASGGPGALFWMLLWAFFGMTVKFVEVTLACYYRNKDETGRFFGGPTWYMKKGLGIERGWKFWPVLAWIFGIGLFGGCLSGNTTFTIAEALNLTFGVPMIPFAVVFSLFLLFVIWKGVNSVGKFASKLVPFMCTAYILGALIIIAANITILPATIVLVIKSAFTGHAAVGGFTGVVVTQAIRYGVARSVYSNEAGFGASPHVHACADCEHPARQGLYGVLEVFVDTVVICTLTGLAVLVANQGTVWYNGEMGSGLSVTAFSSVFGSFGGAFVALMLLLLGLTTQAGWFAYYDVILEQLFVRHKRAKTIILSAFKLFYPIPGLFTIILAVTGGEGPKLTWAIADLISAVPTFVNIIVCVMLCPTLLKILKDYQARYMGIGKVDPTFKVFYDAPRDENGPEA